MFKPERGDQRREDDLYRGPSQRDICERTMLVHTHLELRELETTRLKAITLTLQSAYVA